ncbi:acetyl-CoA carboxylase biotin carboxylase subunit [Candidatus Woesearchaeota archaeon]|nr:acetyl-CoA carboxylase biotin carboxylase subunit [Candidatus Woesearchaeota archaeon]
MLTRGLGTNIGRERDYTVVSKEKLFKRILIANRGEIALRVIRACRELAIETVMVYTKDDKDSLAVKFSDKAYNLGPNGYLDIKRIIAIARKTGADAIHPGYGFLSENSAFAELCLKHRIKFIGPSMKALSLMGDKVKARELAKRLGIPVVSGTKTVLKDEESAAVIAGKIGYPVILKATMGGGGKGMRVIRDEKQLRKEYSSAQNEAEASFGDRSLYMEKYMEDPRHIEFQILADRYGNVIHLGERDCSIQRRHQKLIEEAPSPAMDRKLRDRMGRAAVAIIKSTDYEGAGTVEFLLDRNKNFYFMEVNARIQVEHGVTEMVTGVDLVKEQIKLAAGAKLAFSQDDIKITGWSIECRINAESPLNDFQPEVGRITNYLPPGGPGIRICSSCHTGHFISPHYDSLIAKLMCGGKTRHEAIQRMRRALDEFIIEGVQTTVPFHTAVMHHKQFWKGNVSTSFIENFNILGDLKKNGKRLPKKKELPREERILVVTTAASHYLKKKNRYSRLSKNNAWVSAGRQELIRPEL